MQKKLIALALASLAGSAFAQSNVTVYGVADGFVSNFTGTGGARVTGVNSSGLSPSRFGFKGAEDLGNGLKAVFTMEYAVNLDTQGGTGANASAPGSNAPAAGAATNGLGYTRQSFVGLSSATLGTAVAGVLQTPGFDWSVKYNSLGPSGVIDPYNILAKAPGATITGGLFTANNSDRFGNAIAYVSPNFAGVTVKVARVQNNEALFSNTRFETSSFAADYDNGPLSIGAVYQTVNTGAGQTDYGLGAKYDFGVAKVYAAYGRTKNANANTSILGGAATTGSTKSDSLWSVGASVPLGRGNIVGSYAMLNRDAANSTAALSDAKAYTLAYTYGLSKRTTAYAGYMRVDNNGGGTIGAAGISGAGLQAGGAVSGVFGGLNHTF